MQLYYIYMHLFIYLLSTLLKIQVVSVVKNRQNVYFIFIRYPFLTSKLLLHCTMNIFFVVISVCDMTCLDGVQSSYNFLTSYHTGSASLDTFLGTDSLAALPPHTHTISSHVAFIKLYAHGGHNILT